MQKGYIQLFRELMNWEWYHDSKMVHLFIHFLLSANHKQNKWEGVSIESGQFLTGLNKLSENTGISVQSLRTCIKRLKSTGEITIKSTNKYSVITVVNWELYQIKLIKSTSKSTDKLTNNQQATNKQLTTNNNDNNDNNNKKEIKKKKNKFITKNKYAEYVFMKEKEYKKLIMTLGKKETQECINILDNYKGSNGKEYKSDYHAILSWVVDKLKEKKKSEVKDFSPDMPDL